MKNIIPILTTLCIWSFACLAIEYLPPPLTTVK